jgi:hypothetical protein
MLKYVHSRTIYKIMFSLKPIVNIQDVQTP